MRKALTVLLTALLVAAAFFLPGQLSLWGDRSLLNRPQIIQQEEREGFAESMQLTVAEKLLLMRSGTLSRMELSGAMIQGFYDAEANINFFIDSYAEDESLRAFLKTAAEEELSDYNEAARQLWEERIAAVRREVRTLQAMGGLPELWDAGSELEFTSYGDHLYVDTATQMSFQVYTVSLCYAPYSLDVTVDIQSGRILAFRLGWSDGSALRWGLRGAANFGTAWRDYWDMDSVASGWYNNYNRSILEELSEAAVRVNGDYASHGQISFSYDSQSIPISLECWGNGYRDCSLLWNFLL